MRRALQISIFLCYILVGCSKASHNEASPIDNCSLAARTVGSWTTPRIGGDELIAEPHVQPSGQLTTKITIALGTKANVRSARILSSSGCVAFDRASLRAATRAPYRAGPNHLIMVYTWEP